MADEDVPFDPDAQMGNFPLYFLMLAYLAVLVRMGFIGKRWKEESMNKGEVAAHFSGSFGQGFLVLTTFASVFSGYTVVGIPTESSNAGYFAIRWIVGVLAIGFSMILFYPRLRRLALARGYQSPNDFVSDRYRSKTLTAFASVFACIPQIFYMTVQLVSFAELLNGVSAGLFSKEVAMAIFAIVVLVLEKIGGMSSVVLSDAVQAAIMVVGFIAMFFVIQADYGSLSALGPADCPTLAYVNVTHREQLILEERYDDVPHTCEAAGPNCSAFGCILAARPEFASPLGSTQLSQIFWFFFNNLAFGLNPQMLQRAYIARSDEALKTTIMSLAGAAFLGILPSMVAGITTAAFSSSWPASSAQSQAFAAISNEIKKRGPWRYGLVSVLTCSALAAIMSTADSVLLGASNVLAVDIFQGMLRPQASQAEVVTFSTVISVIVMVVSYIAALQITSADFVNFLIFQNGLYLQLVPTFLAGLFSAGASVRALLSGIVVGLAVLAGTVAVEAFTSFSAPIPVPNIAMFANFAVTFLVQIAGPRLPAGGQEAAAAAETAKAEEGEYAQALRGRFGEPVTLEEIKRLMQGTAEPSLLVGVVACAVIFLCVPFYGTYLADLGLLWGFPVWAVVWFSGTVLAACTHLWFAGSWRPKEWDGGMLQADGTTAAAGTALRGFSEISMTTPVL